MQKHKSAYMGGNDLMKRIFYIILVLGMLFTMTSCSKNDTTATNRIAGNTFVWEKEGFGGDFTIKLNKDGTYEYCVGFLSSYIGLGDWSVTGSLLTLTEKSWPDTIFQFYIRGGELFFISEESSQFMHINVEDGDRFMLK